MGYTSAEVVARKVLDLYHSSSALAVDPLSIASKIGIKVIPSFEPGISGAAYIEPNSGDYIIEYSDFESFEPRRRFTIAHELGHHILGHTKAGKHFRENLFSPDFVRTPEEIDANKFAAELLMPSNLVFAAFTSDKINSINAMAQAFGVSNEAMKHRLKNLGIAAF